MKVAATILAMLSLTASARGQEMAPPLAAYHDLLARPPFTPSRRPSPIANVAKLASSSLRLTGLVTESGKKIALLRSDEQKSEVRVGLGASLNGWQLAAIDGQGIELSNGRELLRIHLKQIIPPASE